MNGIKRIFGNKVVVSIVGLILVVGLLYFSYSKAVSSATTPVSVCVATQTIQPRTKITTAMVKTVDVPGNATSSNVIRSCSLVTNKYSNYNTMIPAGSMFYNETVIEEAELPDAAFLDIKEGDVAYNFPVTMNSTYGNSLYPGKKMDIYMKVIDENGQVKVGRLFRDIKIAAVKDSSGRNVFEVSDNSRTPAFIIFGLSCDYYNLLKKASYLSAYSVELFPVPSNMNIDVEDTEVSVTSKQLEDFVRSHTVANDEAEFLECVVADTEDEEITPSTDADQDTETDQATE